MPTPEKVEDLSTEIIPLHTVRNGVEAPEENDVEVLITSMGEALQIDLGSGDNAPMIWLEHDAEVGWKLLLSGNGSRQSGEVRIKDGKVTIETV